MEVLERWGREALRGADGALRVSRSWAERTARQASVWVRSSPNFPTDINSAELLRKGAPIMAVAAYSSLAVVVAEPRVATRLFPKHDVTNFLLLTSFTGVSVWLWRRPHISGTSPGRRFPWVFLGSSMYVLGSVLMWAIVRSAVGQHPLVSVSLGLVSGGALTYSAIDYFHYLDKDFDPIEYQSEPIEDINHSDDEKYDLDL